MDGTFVKAMIAATVAGLAVGVGGILWLDDSPSEPTMVTDNARGKVTLTVGAGGGKDIVVFYSCPNREGTMDTCGPESIPPDDFVWFTQVTVPVGTTVRVQARGSAGGPVPECWISDETDQLTLDRQTGTDARCSTVAE